MYNPISWDGEILESEDVEEPRDINERNLKALHHSLSTTAKEQIKTKEIKPSESFSQIKEHTAYNKRENIGIKTYHPDTEDLESKLDRIKAELLTIEQYSIANEKEGSLTKDITSSGPIVEKIEKLNKRIRDMKESKGFLITMQKLGDNPQGEKVNISAKNSGMNPQAQVAKSKILFTHMQDLEKVPLEDDKFLKKKIHTEAKVQLYLDDTHRQLQNFNRFEELEKRLMSLDSKIGKWKSIKKEANVSRSLELLENKLDIMLNQNLEDLTTRTHNVNKEIAEILDKKEEIEDVIIDPAKIYDLHALTEPAIEYSNKLPTIVKRLQCLKMIHDKSAQIHNQVKNLESFQTQIKSTLENDGKTAEYLTNYFNDNKKRIQANISSLQDRINKLAK